MENKPPLNAVVVTIGLLVFLEGLAGIIYGGQYRSFPPAFPIVGLGAGSSRVPLSPFDLFTLGSVLGTALLLGLLFQLTRLGLGAPGRLDSQCGSAQISFR